MQNRFTEDDPTAFPYTTILIPISNEHSLSTTTQFFSFHSISSDSSKGFQRTIIIGISLLVLSSVFPKGLEIYKFKEVRVASKDFSTKVGFSCRRWVIGGQVAAIKKMSKDVSEAIISIIEEDDGEIELGRLIEPCLMAKYSMKLFLRMVKLNLACLEQEPESRPSMAEKSPHR
ncbi:hypothetical protein POTOM_026885 [Populus tomentosa]|uniref:Uncharacterized protein n=1 Tax=Populus tomentosa TaxID=118781 RepID=A0A8X8CVJ3_POPTO|nr:hypothetical protein POTOM_026885 [Populus tomentosa]